MVPHVRQAEAMGREELGCNLRLMCRDKAWDSEAKHKQDTGVD